jgi:hypothetical protein
MVVPPFVVVVGPREDSNLCARVRSPVLFR